MINIRVLGLAYWMLILGVLSRNCPSEQEKVDCEFLSENGGAGATDRDSSSNPDTDTVRGEVDETPVSTVGNQADITSIKLTTKFDLSDAFKQLSKKDVLLIAIALCDNGPMTRTRLKSYTELPAGRLSRALKDMSNSCLVMKDRGSKLFYPTKYCAFLVNGFRAVMNKCQSESDALLEPVKLL